MATGTQCPDAGKSLGRGRLHHPWRHGLCPLHRQWSSESVRSPAGAQPADNHALPGLPDAGFGIFGFMEHAADERSRRRGFTG